MSVVPLVLLIAVLLSAIGLMVFMFVKDRPLCGVMALGLLAGPSPLLALLHLSVA
ncbi:hypothetical protein ACFV4N_43500 [Actinosynnema sp. NPDC059797]